MQSGITLLQEFQVFTPFDKGNVSLHTILRHLNRHLSQLAFSATTAQGKDAVQNSHWKESALARNSLGCNEIIAFQNN